MSRAIGNYKIYHSTLSRGGEACRLANPTTPTERR
jgi:hypothetical protein